MRIVEFAGIGPGPMAAMLLADMGAEVIRIDRLEPSNLGIPKPDRYNLLMRGRRSVAIDLKQAAGVELALRLTGQCDALIEVDSVLQPAPAPRFSRTVTGIPAAPERAGQSTREVLGAFGLADREMTILAEQGVIRLMAGQVGDAIAASDSGAALMATEKSAMMR